MVTTGFAWRGGPGLVKKECNFMQMQIVTSSNISEVGHDDKANIMLVRFKNGKYYQFDNVDRSVYDALITATSVGKFFNKNIRNNFLCKEVSIKDESIK